MGFLPAGDPFLDCFKGKPKGNHLEELVAPKLRNTRVSLSFWGKEPQTSFPVLKGDQRKALILGSPNFGTRPYCYTEPPASDNEEHMLGRQTDRHNLRD